jgi:hypothetical protein
MRFMILLKADKTTEAGVLPSEEQLARMGKYNEELQKAGVLLAGEGLQPSSKGARVTFSGDARTVTEGPFPGPQDLIAGFWMIEVGSREEAIEWVKRCPNPLEGEAEIEIRRVYEAEDFGAELTPELREAEERLRAQTTARKGPAGSHVIHFEIHASEPEVLIDFYTALLGWHFVKQDALDYWLIALCGDPSPGRPSRRR